MISRWLLSTVIAILLSTSAAAQTHSVRVTFNTNLRAGYSLQARIIDTATAGTTISVAGNHENWLQIDWNGRQVWMADWVPMTRVEGGATLSDVDNCCFLDRQCNTDHEWVAGYWAYQNNQCGAPISPAIGESSSVSSESSAVVDNCCQIGWNCNNDHDWRTGFMAYHTKQCQHYGIEIEGPESFVAQLHSTLDLIRDRAPYWYAYIIDGLTKIRLDPNARRSGVYSHSGTWHVPPSRVESWGDTVSIVGSLAHEACHTHRHLAGQVSGGLSGERACLEAQIAVARAVYPSGHESYLDWATNLLANIEDPAYQWWH